METTTETLYYEDIQFKATLKDRSVLFSNHVRGVTRYGELPSVKVTYGYKFPDRHWHKTLFTKRLYFKKLGLKVYMDELVEFTKIVIPVECI